MKPSWLKIRLPAGSGNKRYNFVKNALQKTKLCTVCEEARCPNIAECWASGTATFMIMGDTCTRACKFCAVKTGNPNGILDELEPEKLAQAVFELNLNYVVITSVDRDDLEDFGANHFVKCIKHIKKLNPKILIEVLTPDFNANPRCVKIVIDAKPDVFGHNIETVKRLQREVRDLRASYEKSLAVLKYAKKFNPKILTKSSIMVGLGEKEKEVISTMKDLRDADVDILTIGQYLQPSKWNLPVKEYIHPEKFEYYKKQGEKIGFLFVASGPFVRSSYKAGELFMKHVFAA